MELYRRFLSCVNWTAPRVKWIAFLACILCLIAAFTFHALRFDTTKVLLGAAMFFVILVIAMTLEKVAAARIGDKKDD
jgi:hypothetical protein